MMATLTWVMVATVYAKLSVAVMAGLITARLATMATRFKVTAATINAGARCVETTVWIRARLATTAMITSATAAPMAACWLHAATEFSAWISKWEKLA